MLDVRREALGHAAEAVKVGVREGEGGIEYINRRR